MAALPRQPAPLDRPLPLRFIFPLLFVGVYLAHLTLLRLPYYWDEAGYYIPAAYDFFRTGDVIPTRPPWPMPIHRFPRFISLCGGSPDSRRPLPAPPCA